MSALSIQVPFPVFQGRDGQPLENGYVWIGEPNLNPQTNPVVAYFDAALTIPAAQPLRTLNGYVSRAGTPAQIYVDGVNFSILVQDSKGSMVYNFPDGTGISPDACGITYDPPFTDAVPYPVCEKLAQTVSVLDFGENTVPGTTDMTAAIQAALDATPFEVIFPDAGPYKTTAPITIPIGKSVQLGNAAIEAHFNNGYIFQFERDPTGRPKFYLEGKGGAIRGAGAFAYDATLNGVLVESSSFSRVGGFSISAVNRPIVIAPSGARDCINNVYYNIDTNTTNGMRINAGTVGGVTYQDTTTGQFNDIFFTCIGPASNAIELVANGPAGSIFGLNFNRCSFNPVHSGGGRYIYMVADPVVNAATIYNIYFNNCEGELRYTDVGPPTIPAIYMERVFNSKIQFTGYWDEANGIKLVKCSGNIFENIRDSVTAFTTAKFIDIDANCFGNTFTNVYPQLSLLSTDEGFTNAPLAANYFQRIVDDSNRNNFTGLLSSNVNRVFKTDYLNLLNSGGDPINPLFPTSYPSTTTWVDNGDGTFTATLTSPNGFEFNIPSEVPLGSKVVIRLKYRFVGVTTETNWRLASSVSATLRAPTMRISEDWVDMMYMTEITSRDCRVFSPSANPTVTLDVEKLEVFLDAFPYPSNYRPTDVYDNQFAAHPYGTTANRPVSPPLMTNYFDTTLNKLITWDGTNWRDGAGTIV